MELIESNDESIKDAINEFLATSANVPFASFPKLELTLFADHFLIDILYVRIIRPIGRFKR